MESVTDGMESFKKEIVKFGTGLPKMSSSLPMHCVVGKSLAATGAVENGIKVTRADTLSPVPGPEPEGPDGEPQKLFAASRVTVTLVLFTPAPFPKISLT